LCGPPQHDHGHAAGRDQPVQAGDRVAARHRIPLGPRHARQGLGRMHDVEAKANWDTNERGAGREKIFEVRKIYNDLTFIDEFLTPDFCKRAKLFTYDYNPTSGEYEISSRSFRMIKEKLKTSLTNMGEPYIRVEDGNYQNRGELLLRHRHDGFDLDDNYAKETLKNVRRIWNRPVWLGTEEEGKEVLLGYDGKEFTREDS